MDRTQIYLSREQVAALDREARRASTTRSHLIREAIDRSYLTNMDRDRVVRGLRVAAGAWKGRKETGEAYVERIRGTGRMARVWPAGSERDDPSSS